MKEYLEKQADGSYKLVMRGIVGKDGDIEVPEGADVAVYPHFSKGISFFKNNFRFAYADSSGEWEETDYCPENLKHWKSWRVAWQRHTQPEELPFVDSINDQYAEIEQVRQSGMKFDGNKPRYSLLPKGAVNSVIEVLEFGAKKYSADNWQEVDNAKERYYNAAMRHIDLWWNGEKLDSETNVHHLAHAATNLFFLMWFDNK